MTPSKEKTTRIECGSGELGKKGGKSDGTGSEQSIEVDKTELKPISGSKGKEKSKDGQPENSKQRTLGEQDGVSSASIHRTDKNTTVVVPPSSQVTADESRTHSSDSSTQASCLEPVRKPTHPPRNPEDTNLLNSYSSISTISNGDHDISLTTLQTAIVTGTSDDKNDDPIFK
ncbi:hypothetical protein POVCU2_0070500 [Plasmodium ovale curtisi]|uniref:Uncharacterized protein n=1 Tax=Plasmodium ovale curtisi TaxID=864141 RepID=A0A1A8WFY2_PLAOA|nr:hypothetical protein POVCU2_0070500 [Plasmodium ovale curtisi]